MTEAEWLACTDPQPMLEWLRSAKPQTEPADWVVNRKARLFGCACLRGVWQFLDSRSRAAVEVMERLVDGLASEQERLHAEEAARDAARDAASADADDDNEAVMDADDEVRADAAEAAMDLLRPPDHPWHTNGVDYSTARATALHKGCLIDRHYPWGELLPAERKAQSHHLRCIFGNPFRPVTLTPSWLTPPVQQLAKAIYGDRACDRMPILADALEEAGCTNADILAHCRGPGPHVRGCWALDLLLGKR